LFFNSLLLPPPNLRLLSFPASVNFLDDSWLYQASQNRLLKLLNSTLVKPVAAFILLGLFMWYYLTSANKTKYNLKVNP